MEAIAGRRARRFCMGAEIPDGSLAFKSKHKPLPLNEIEQLLVLTSMGGVTGWHFAIMRHARCAPRLSNYCGSPVGRTYPSAAGFVTSELRKPIPGVEKFNNKVIDANKTSTYFYGTVFIS